MVNSFYLASLEIPVANWIKSHKEGCIVLLYIQPGASENLISGVHGERLKVKVKAPPRDGEANEALIEFLAKVLKISKSGICFVRGESSRNKDLFIELPLEKVVTLLK